MLATGPSAHYNLAQAISQLVTRFGWTRLSIINDLVSKDNVFSALAALYDNVLRSYLFNHAFWVDPRFLPFDSTVELNCAETLRLAATYSTGNVFILVYN